MTEPHEIHKPLNYPEIGPKESYLIYHEELESLVKNYPDIKKSQVLDDIRTGISYSSSCNSKYWNGRH